MNIKKLEQVQQKLIDDYGYLVQTFIENNRLHINYKDRGYNTRVSLCFNNNLRIYINSINIDFKNVSSIIDYLKINVFGE